MASSFRVRIMTDTGSFPLSPPFFLNAAPQVVSVGGVLISPEASVGEVPAGHFAPEGGKALRPLDEDALQGEAVGGDASFPHPMRSGAGICGVDHCLAHCGIEGGIGVTEAFY